MQTIAVETQVADHLRINLSWGEVAQAPETSEFIRLTEGEEFTIPAGNATSIRSVDGWQKAYAFDDTVITGPVDISEPQPMLPKEFAPGIFEVSFVTKVAMFCTIVWAALLPFVLGDIGVLGILGAWIGVSVTATFVMFFLMKAERRRLVQSGKDSCAPSIDRVFLRADLTAAQREGIRPEGLNQNAYSTNLSIKPALKDL